MFHLSLANDSSALFSIKNGTHFLPLPVSFSCEVLYATVCKIAIIEEEWIHGFCMPECLSELVRINEETKDLLQVYKDSLATKGEPCKFPLTISNNLQTFGSSEIGIR